jgi:inosine triphosphate pyrophosphatase
MQLRIAFVTGNSRKADEMNRILAEHGATAGPTPETSMVKLTVVNVDLPELQEVDTLAIAKDKALLAAQLAGGPAVVEDTSLGFQALGSMPGPYIKWFQDRLKSEGLYNILAAYDDKSATAVCTLAFCPAPHADPVLFTGECKGRIIAPQPGGGFGWDSIFVPGTFRFLSCHRLQYTRNHLSLSSQHKHPDGYDRPFSQMTVEEKNQLSHRGNAVRKWADWLAKNREALYLRQEGAKAVGHKGLNFKSAYPEQ